jgi:hypothetical protein
LDLPSAVSIKRLFSCPEKGFERGGAVLAFGLSRGGMNHPQKSTKASPQNKLSDFET